MRHPTLDDRLKARVRPGGWPIMYQSWHDLLFLHWPVEARHLRELVPQQLGIDTFEGSAYISLTPLTMVNVRPIFGPPLPLISNFYEINCRTYVFHDGVPGIWFFSLDANALLPVLGARAAYHLPYYYSSISFSVEGDRRTCELKRSGDRAAQMRAVWSGEGDAHNAEPRTLEFFLTERYYLFAARGQKVYRGRIWHRPWPLYPVKLLQFDSSLFEAQGLPRPESQPMVSGGGPVDVEVWPLETIMS